MKDQRLSRRKVLTGAAGLTAWGLAGLPDLNAASSDETDFPIAACDWTLKKRANKGSFAVADKIGLDGVQVSLGTVGDNMKLRRPEVRKKFLEAARKHDQKVASLAIAGLNRVPLKGDDPRPEKWIRDSAEACAAMGADVVLLAFFGDGEILKDKKGRQRVADKMKRLAPAAEEAGVVFGVESTLNADQHMRLLDEINSPAVKVYYDVGNMTHRGYDVPAEIRQLGDRICEVHIKDRKDLYGRGEVDFPAVKKALDDIGYRDWLVMEGTKTPMGLVDSFRYDAKYLRKLFR